MSSQLWTDERIKSRAKLLTYVGGRCVAYLAVAKEVRDDLQARVAELQTLIDNDAVAYITTLTAKEARIAELEGKLAQRDGLIYQLTEIDMEVQEQAIAALEAQLAEAQRWEPVPDGWFDREWVATEPEHIADAKYMVRVYSGADGLRYITEYSMGKVVNDYALNDGVALCRRAEKGEL